MYYRIADIVFRSQLHLSSFEAFICDPCEPDAVLDVTDEIPPEGTDTVAGSIVCRKTRDGWFLYSASSREGGLFVSSDYTHMRLIRESTLCLPLVEKLWIRVSLECLLARHGYISLHSACVSLDDQFAIAFTGPSGIGKSTRAGAWQEAFRASLVSGDRPLIRVSDAEVFGVPWDGKECCYRSIHYPLRAICDVRRSGSVYIRKMSFQQKRRLLMRQCFIPMWDAETAAVQMMNISHLASRANIVRAFCGPAADDAKALRQMLDNNQLMEEKQDMKAKSGFVLRHIMDDYMLMPTDDNINLFNGTLLMNEVSSFIWEKLQNPVSRDDLLAALMDQYATDEKTASADLDNLLAKLRNYGVIEDD